MRAFPYPSGPSRTMLAKDPQAPRRTWRRTMRAIHSPSSTIRVVTPLSLLLPHHVLCRMSALMQSQPSTGKRDSNQFN